MELISRINSFLELGIRLGKLDSDTLTKLVDRASEQNPWFNRENIKLSFDGLKNYLDESKLRHWLNQYQIPKRKSLNVGLVLAGNIPMVGIHDLLCTVISGHKAIIKLSSQDNIIIPFIVQELVKIAPRLENQIQFVEKLKGVDAIIATGSDNTARYFEYYFGKYPHIIRKNRTSIAILDNKESDEELERLGDDIFSYFGLGCRNVSKIFIPTGYEIESLILQFNKYSNLINHNKYCNNYYYNKSILLVNNTKFIDGEFLLFQQSDNLVSPISVIYYDYYNNPEKLESHLKSIDHKIQCVISKVKEFKNSTPLGLAQKPEIWDYADNIDTMKFLTKL